jgi:hypothetical protein
MAQRPMNLREPAEPGQEIEQNTLSQRKRPELGRFLLQVDGQTKSSHTTSEAAEKAGMVIKNGYPILQVAVYDKVESVNKIIEPSTT